MLLITLFAYLLSAQETEGCDEFPLDCSTMSIQIEAVASCPGTSCNVPCNCKQQRFNVYLNVESNSNVPPCLNYETLLVEVKMEVQPGQPGLPTYSRINIEETGTCNWTQKRTLAFSGNTVSLQLAASNGTLPVMALSAHTFLFTIIMDVWQGETITANCEGALYSWVDHNEVPGMCPFDEGDPLSLTVPFPTFDERLSVFFGEPNQNNAGYQLLPLIIHSTEDISVQQFAVSFALDETVINFGVPVFISGGPFSYEVEGPDIVTNAATGLKQYFYRVTMSGGNLEKGDNLILWAKITPPATFYKCGKMCPSITAATVQFSNTDCKRPDIQPDAPKCADFGNCLANCAENISIKVVGDGVQGTQPGQCKYRAKIGFDWAGSNETYQLTQLKLSFEFSGTNFSILSAIPLGAIFCPAYNNNPNVCTSNCVVIDGNKVTYCFSKGPGTDNLIIRKSLNGTSVFSDIIFDAPAGGCLSDVILTEAVFGFAGAGAECVPFTTLNKFSFPVCTPYIQGSIKTEAAKGVRYTNVSAATAFCNTPTTETTDMGDYSVCVCGFNTFTVTPSRNDNHLNGVTTSDLAAISKHILGITPFATPHKIIAADANKDNKTSTLDIVALRRLILGIDDDLPANTSWRFVPVSYSFPNPQNPFASGFPENLSVTVTNAQSVQHADFTGIKIGDVNDSVIPKYQSQTLPFSAPAQPLQYGETISLPVRSNSDQPLTAFQAAIRFDPEALEFLGPAAGDVSGISPDCFGLKDVAKGIIRVVWLATDPMDEPLRSGQILCQLNFKAKRRLLAPEMALTFDQSDRLRPEGYTLHDDVYPLALERTAVVERDNPATTNGIQAYCRPNPAKGAVSLVLETAQPVEMARLFILNGFGIKMLYREVELPKGRSEIAIDGAADWPSGLYAWVLLSGSDRISEGNFVKSE